MKNFNQWLQEDAHKTLDDGYGALLDRVAAAVKKRYLKAGFNPVKTLYRRRDNADWDTYIPVIEHAVELHAFKMLLGTKTLNFALVDLKRLLRPHYAHGKTTWIDLTINDKEVTLDLEPGNTDAQIEAELDKKIEQTKSWAWPLKLGLPSWWEFLKILGDRKLLNNKNQIDSQALIDLTRDELDEIKSYYDVWKDNRDAPVRAGPIWNDWPTIFTNVAGLFINPGDEDIGL